MLSQFVLIGRLALDSGLSYTVTKSRREGFLTELVLMEGSLYLLFANPRLLFYLRRSA